MNTRIGEVRKSLGLNQQEFASRIGLTRNYVSLMETGDRTPSERTVSDICREFDVNEKWLRTGEGSMSVSKTLHQEMVEIVQAASQITPQEARERLNHIFDRMPEAELLLIYQILRSNLPMLFHAISP